MNTKPQRIQLRRTKGWQMPPNTVKVDRSTRWGNPFRVEQIDGGGAWIVVDPNGDDWGEETTKDCATLRAVLLFSLHTGVFGLLEDIGLAAPRELAGKNLACWCPLGSPCHADILLEIANREVSS